MAGATVGADLWLNETITPWDIYAHGALGVLAYRKTQYQEMYIVQSGSYGKALMLDGKWQSATADEFLYHEGLVHPALVLHGQPRQVLILGGAEGATIREVLRWKSIERVVMVDIDGEVVQACRDLLPEMHQNAFDDPRVELVIADAQTFMANTAEKWDAVIADLSDPIEDGPAFPLFTQEFYTQVRSVLTPEGFLVVQSGNLTLPELHIHARFFKTVQSVFPYANTCTCHAMSYGVPLSFILARQTPFNTVPEPAETDRLLAEQTTGGFRLMDGTTVLGMMQTPRYVRDRIAQETQIYTLKSPPKPFGKGTIQ
ncbi:spermidine synthase [Synechococcales cyanobacterium C]|uniref:Polyamine aminopropyltransferase n=1 Tax=Petrachloros mirabilis ULC683 TaxID=2781853 RepID=A0A8K1ZY44_9CYAN|nr:spermidine synthase [Petrachloros mirabilis]NCJ06146.1 spermidine synthase [Petrachloros mirabilis ULC683]